MAERAEALQSEEPEERQRLLLAGLRAGPLRQGISVAKALAQGLGGKVKAALETTIKLAPKHADAHIALGSYHAEIIDKVGAMIGGLTYGAKKDAALKNFQTALKLKPDSAIARIEYANGLVMLFGKNADEGGREAVRRGGELRARWTRWSGSTSSWRRRSSRTRRASRPARRHALRRDRCRRAELALDERRIARRVPRFHQDREQQALEFGAETARSIRSGSGTRPASVIRPNCTPPL